VLFKAVSQNIHNIILYPDTCCSRQYLRTSITPYCILTRVIQGSISGQPQHHIVSIIIKQTLKQSNNCFLKFTVAQLVQEILYFYETRHWNIFWARSILSTSLHSISVKILFSIIFPSVPALPRLSLRLKLSDQNFVCISNLSHGRHMQNNLRYKGRTSEWWLINYVVAYYSIVMDGVLGANSRIPESKRDGRPNLWHAILYLCSSWKRLQKHHFPGPAMSVSYGTFECKKLHYDCERGQGGGRGGPPTLTTVVESVHFLVVISTCTAWRSQVTSGHSNKYQHITLL